MFKPFYANTHAFYVNTRPFYLNNQLFVVRHSVILSNNVVCMTHVTMQLHVREHNNSSKMVSSNDQDEGQEGADMEIQQQNMDVVSSLE
jgi:hypothetical protein